MDWDDFRVFLEVALQGSFNRAAAKLNMTQPTVSRRLMRLEKAIGARLFERDRRGPRLTQDGRRIYNDAIAAQAALNRAANRTSHSGKRVDGECKLFMGDGIASYWVTRFLAPFFNRYPGIELKLFGAYDVAADKRDMFDLHTQYHQTVEAGEVSVHLATLHYIPFGSCEYFRTHDMPRSVKDLSSHRLLDVAAYLGDIGSLTSWSLEGTALRTAFFTNLSACLAEAVCHSAGIALLPTYATIVDKAFVPLEIGIRFPVPIFVSYYPDTLKKWPVRTTLDYLRTCVFDRKTMPWFADSYIPPSADWTEHYANAMKQAAHADSGEKPYFAEMSEGKPRFGSRAARR